MKNKITKNRVIIFFVVALVFIIKFVYNSSIHNWSHYSSTIVDAVKHNVFISKYDVIGKEIYEEAKSNDLCQCLSKAEIWKENKWDIRPKFLFFHSINKQDKEVLVLKLPECFDLYSSNPIYIRIGDQRYSGSMRENGVIGLEHEEGDFPNVLKLVIYSSRKKDICSLTITTAAVNLAN
ncbi:MAG: hypothetical protein R2828_21530 [Saprospiraceae bacterium]